MHATELIFLLIVVGSIVAFVKLNSGEALRFETTSSARQITMTAVGLVATKRKWNTLSQGDGSANFAYHRGTNKLILMLLGVDGQRLLLARQDPVHDPGHQE